MKKYLLHREPPRFSVDYAKDLNPEQLAAVMHGEGPALVLAGAGTGKTRVVTYRVARLIETGTPAENILLLTFTNKAAREMLRRVELLIGMNISGLFGGTFHHIANLLLRQHCQLIGYRQGFSILDREDSKELFDACIADVYQKETVLPKGSVLAEICSLSRNTDMPVEDVVLRRFSHFSHLLEEIVKIAGLYDKKKVHLNLLDFDDLLHGWKRLFTEHPKIREYYSIKFRHLLVDEYQDTNKLQAGIIDLTTGPEGNLMVVGDDAQSIYSFRGADFENILKFPEKHEGTALYKLTTNYRSTPQVLHLANSSILHNRRQFRKDLHAVSAAGELPYMVALKDVFEQAEFVASVVIDLNADGRSFNEIAVLYRSHFQSMELQMEFQRKGIPFDVRSGLTFFEQAHIKDTLAFLKIVANPHDEISWKRVLKLTPGIGNITAAKIWNFIQQEEKPVEAVFDAYKLVPKKAVTAFNNFLEMLSVLKHERYLGMPSAAIDYVMQHGYEDHLHATYPNADMRVEDVTQMMKFAQRYDLLETFLSEMTLQGLADAAEGAEASEGKVILSSVHQAKGLEWNTVFLIGLNDGKFPSAKSLKNEDEEEERRLFYVGVTRAKESLYLCYPVVADDWQTMGIAQQSRFLKELPSDCFEEMAVEDV
ncbi:MAG: ATP-dependent helicase [Nitrospirae bacterium]|nr:ATP-dependent helicase [Nitrospirota bacterium]